MQNEPGLEVESTNLYLQAALKFLQPAALVENDNTDINCAGETQLMVVYNNTATLYKQVGLHHILHPSSSWPFAQIVLWSFQEL